MGRSVVFQFGALCIALLLAVAPVLAQVQAAAGKAEDIKAMLLGTATWHADWTKPGDSGVSEIVFEARGDKAVAKLVKITPPTMSCEHDVTITTGVVKFDACCLSDGDDLTMFADLLAPLALSAQAPPPQLPLGRVSGRGMDTGDSLRLTTTGRKCLRQRGGGGRRVGRILLLA